MLELLSAVENSALGHALRGAGVWTYGVLNLGHVLGLSLLIGSVVLLDLRLLGAWRATPLAALARPTVPLAGLGLAIAVASGICMVSVNATEYYGNPFLLLKFAAIGLGLVNVAVVSRLPAWRAKGEREPTGREATQLAIAGGVSLVAWLAALACGRMIGYW
ncbi:MAG TPA: DUF6644 family protein [Gammaproteobacteria bacterium]